MSLVLPAAGRRPYTPIGDLVSRGYRYDWVMQSELAEDLGGGKKPLKPAMTKLVKTRITFILETRLVTIFML